jgi:hypothetical protein
LDELPLGGLSTSISALKANLFLSIAVAITGICLPIGLSFSLLRLANATSLQAFAAGAALCSTSLGTTFTVLKTSALTKSRLGVVLTSAAMMDDVVGLVMVQIISNLRSGSAGARATTVIRPVFVSLAFAVILPLCCRFLLLPAWLWLESNKGMLGLKHVLHRRETPFLLHTCLLLGFVTGASYAGTSNLFAAYLAGAMISWWDALTAPSARQDRPSPSLAATIDSQDRVPEEGAGEGQSGRCRALEQYTNCPEPSGGPLIGDNTIEALVSKRGPSSVAEMLSKATQTIPETSGLILQVNSRTGVAVYEQYYLAPVDRILKPLFFVKLNHRHHFWANANLDLRPPLVSQSPSRKCSAAPSSGAELSTPPSWPPASWPVVSGLSVSILITHFAYAGRIKKIRSGRKTNLSLAPILHVPLHGPD